MSGFEGVGCCVFEGWSCAVSWGVDGEVDVRVAGDGGFVELREEVRARILAIGDELVQTAFVDLGDMAHYWYGI